MQNINKGFTFNRSIIKHYARVNLRHHYLIFVGACLILLLVQTEFVRTDYFINMRSMVMEYALNAGDEYLDKETADKVRLETIKANQDTDLFTASVINKLESIGDGIESQSGHLAFSRTKGTLNQIIDYVAGDTFISHSFAVISKIVGDPHAANIIITLAFTAVSFAWWFFVRNLLVSSSRRIFLEARTYKKVPVSRFLIFMRARRWVSASWTMFLVWLFELLASFTIVLYPVVHYGLFFVPFIIAENPDIGAIDAIKLSWNMMRGSKLKIFVTDLTLLGWSILGALTLGILDMLYTNPYRICIYSELYACARDHAKAKAMNNADLLCDEYLFAKCNSNKLGEVYKDVIEEIEAGGCTLPSLKGRSKFIADHFGVVLWNTKDEMDYERAQEKRLKLITYKSEAEGEMYPSRLSAFPEHRKLKSIAHIHYMRHYSLLSLVVMFFIFSGFGWVWELFYYYMQQGRLINRGVLHGPWLPIYGAGGLIVLIFLHAFREKPVIHFWATVVLCGAVEYLGSVALELIFHAKWWDYEGYFLNIDGRVCAEGLFVFGVAGMAFIYVLAPLLDNLIRRANQKVLTPVAAVFVAIFIADMIYSRFVPNTGDGITGNFDKGDTAVTVEQTIE